MKKMWRKRNPIQNPRPRTPGPRPPEKIHIQTRRPRTPAGGENPHPNPLVVLLSAAAESLFNIITTKMMVKENEVFLQKTIFKKIADYLSSNRLLRNPLSKRNTSQRIS